MKFEVPSSGSTSQAAGESRNAPGRPGSSAVASSPTTGASTCSRSRRVIIASASRSATVTSSPGDFSMTSPSARALKRGRIAVSAASRKISVTVSRRMASSLGAGAASREAAPCSHDQDQEIVTSSAFTNMTRWPNWIS
ncbi:hypothetical protein OIE66_03935 [Nonomuraea sp. NBC_01738]|nr:hypothetical protein OIE66_03935 [Nonomuraea sp. NBC_01738]